MINRLFLSLLLLLLPVLAYAGATTVDSNNVLDLTNHTVGTIAAVIFAVAYMAVICEECTGLRKSKPVIIAAGAIWAMVGYVYVEQGMGHVAEAAARVNLLEYAELMLFLLVAMTYINAMDERKVFLALRVWLIRKGFSYRQLFWMIGLLSFSMSPLADNLATALLMCAIAKAVGGGSVRFVSLCCINIVVSVNAGGAFSPFGDITTLMVWQKGVLEFELFFVLFVPALVSFLIPAALMHFAVPTGCPNGDEEQVHMERGANRIMLLFILTIVTAVYFNKNLDLPPVIGMLAGLGYLQIMGFYLRKTHETEPYFDHYTYDDANRMVGDVVPFDIFNRVARAEWDTLLFFYGVVLCVGGLGFMGYMSLASEAMYGGWGATWANIAVGGLSAVIDNIPVMYAVLSMQPDMSSGQWLLVTLAAGVGGSILSIGSAAGVALMGQAREQYTFFGHLKWAPAIALGYAGSVATHLWLNSGFM